MILIFRIASENLHLDCIPEPGVQYNCNSGKISNFTSCNKEVKCATCQILRCEVLRASAGRQLVRQCTEIRFC